MTESLTYADIQPEPNRTGPIKWHYQGDHGSWMSTEGRFSIGGIGYRNTIRPDSYQATDHGTNTQSPRFDTVGEAKVWCQITLDLWAKQGRNLT